MTNWKTTLFGAVTALGLFLETQPGELISASGKVLQILGTAALGYFAGDSKNKK